MTLTEQLITIACCAGATILTRALPFFLFSAQKPTPKYILYLGKVLPCAVFGMLVIYSVKGVDVLQGQHGLPEAIAIALTVLIHLWRRQMLLSIAVGTISYMLLIQFLFAA